MKKTLIALAAVAATGASFAQSTVTLSGLLDVGLEKRFSGDETRMTSSRNGTSNWTLSGVEDLGGGMKAEFLVSTAFNVDDGTTTSPNALGNNGMFVGLTGGFGTLRAGRPVNTLYANAMFANGTKGVSLHDSNSVLAGLVGNAGNTVYVSNALQYHTPRFSGFQGQFEYAPSELDGADEGYGIAVRYDGGPLSASLTNYRGAGTAAVAATGTAPAVPAILSPESVTQFAAAYDFGVAKVLFTYRDEKEVVIGTTRRGGDGFALGLTAPVGPGIAYVSYQERDTYQDDGSTWIAGYKYLLSKRTQAYVNVGQRDSSYASNAITAAGGTGNDSSTGWGFGLQHSF